jgi:hypothetical protein
VLLKNELISALGLGEIFNSPISAFGKYSFMTPIASFIELDALSISSNSSSNSSFVISDPSLR